MSAKKVALAVVSMLGLAFPALAQSPGSVGEINFHTPKPGMTEKYEAARKKHMAWHKAQKDPWTWFTWEVVSGSREGSYFTGSFGHAWKDFDAQEKLSSADGADFSKGIGPTLGEAHTSYYTMRPDLSLSTIVPGSSPAPYSVISEYLLKPDGVNEFTEAVKKINDGIKKTSYALSGASRWYQLVNGGEGPLFVLVSDRANWAAFAPNDKTLDAMMEEAYGKEQGAAILASLRKTFRSLVSYTIKYRADLSYVPAPTKVAAQ